jgi:hypothetical protein
MRCQTRKQNQAKLGSRSQNCTYNVITKSGTSLLKEKKIAYLFGGKEFFLIFDVSKRNKMNNFSSITDNRLRRDLISLAQSMQGHHFARLAMMMAEERGVELSYEEALKL